MDLVQPFISCFVAEVESEIVGIALYYYRYSTWKDFTFRRSCSQRKMRGTGAGYALYSEIIKQGKKIKSVEWNGMS
jgi:hypothetical protein